jgi:3-oxoacyl-[acyl-carrier protein] reductase
MSDKCIALVTGASRGIGKAIAQQLVEDGFFVIGTATSEGGADNITSYLANSGTGMVLNVTNTVSIASVMEEIKKQYGAPTVLVNNAGITRDNLMLRMKDDEWDDIINTNLSSIFRLSKACLRGMMKNKHGKIVNIASVVGVTGNPGQANYAAAKAGIIGFSKSLAQEVGSRNITVNTVAPGFIDTDMTKALADEQRSALLGGVPLARLGDPKEIAYAVSFLCSNKADYITGETLHVNGGMYMS